jgi:thiol-disulfide isomerase/thioredoxin
MKNRFYIFLLISSLLLVTSCNDELNHIESRDKIKNVKPTPIPTPIVTPKAIVKKELPKKYKFTFTDIEDRDKKVIVEKNSYSFLDTKQSIVLINFFSTWCPPCIGQIPHLNKLQKRYRENLSVLGLLIHDNIKSVDLNKFIASQKINFFISNHQEKNIKFSNFIAPKLQLNANFPLPLMILFLNGRYYTHYEGNIPEEMIESDIKQALKKIKG